MTKAKQETFTAGAVIEVAHPFCRGTFEEFDGDGPHESKTWYPGVRQEFVMPDDSECVADGIGTQIITIVSVHKPGRYPERIFFTRRWRDPSGKEFGKTKLHIVSRQKFKRIIRGYSVEFCLLEKREIAA